ncbi:efflux RND transporter permease subunit [Fulvivirga sediminis]|uniref:Efflux RND transporter permease subunit n=1 Tax=Fulvivirga sediminis TaxID=2803949 RepID=A0A937FD96_9BACT|nr:efflux RND transporter permease subunit [Fulvivirga sediminis]MBL3658785.1 efflux RND transporter permease subunit [Fulvivirga sediminis]
MRNIIKELIQKPMITNIFVGLIIVLGMLTVIQMRSTFLPSEPVSFINITTVYRGASPEELEVDVVNKIEDNLRGLKGIRRVTSTSTESFATVSVEIEDDADPNEALQDVTNAVNRITTFPQPVETPVIVKEEVNNYTMTIGVTGSNSLSDLKDYAKNIQDELLISPLISQVFITGYPEEEIEIRFRENDLRTFNLTFEEVSAAIQQENIKASGGEIKTGQQNILLRLNNRSYNAKGLSDIVIKTTPDGKIIRLSDVATVADQFADKPGQIFVNGEQAVILTLFSRNQEDILDNAAYARNYIKTFNAAHSTIQAKIIEDKSVALDQAIGTLVNNGWQGVLLVVLVLSLFLNPRVAFWVAFKIPVAILGMFILSYFYDLTINQVSLFGMIVVLGVIVDDGVVVAENIYQKYVDGSSPLKAALNGTLEVVPAIVASLSTTVIAFSLFFFLDGRLGDYFSDISFVVCATLFVALLETVFVLPIHMARSKALSKDDRQWKFTQKTNNSLISFRDKYFAKTIDFVLSKPIVGIIGVIIIMALTIVSISSGIIKGTFFPNFDQDVITAQIELPLGTDRSITTKKLEKIEKAVWKVNEYYTSQRDDEQQVIRYTERIVGPNNDQGRINIYMMEGNERGVTSFDIANKIREEVGPIPEATNLAYGTIPIFGKPVSIALLGSNIEDLRGAKKMLRAYLSDRDDLKDITDTDKQGIPELEMALSDKARYLGMNEGVVFNQIRKGFFGLEAQSLQRGDEEIKVWLRYDADDRQSLAQLKDARLRTAEGGSYPIGELATFEEATGVREINHQSGIREIRVEADVATLLTSVPAVIADAEETILKDIKQRYPNIRYTLEGEARLSAETQGSSQGPSIVVFILIITIVLLNYRSLTKTAAILLMLPFAFIGVAWGSFIHNIPVSIFSILGMVALWGILINNGLVLISTYNDNIKVGHNSVESLKDAAISRFRPIVLTTITTVFGLVPLLLNNSLSAQFLKPTAIAISYGLIFGMVLTLIFLPSVFMAFNRMKLWYYTKIRKQQDATITSIDVEVKDQKNELS